ncbi:phosphopentomutase [Mesomycoplasma flocculare]|uniref:Phosphopentomutase n=1 Tax=Mesomycoplasma flocculare TaxID=2128 RepID=A0AAW9XBI7_MESFC|nr:phosphopentomutase [Mesomycoplasma flocculare]MXR05846.1 phosphopentomutase [Mesomycoplasma flocculare]MXR22881.1 phosphopentomutase [Mesomycoplasma flocculare]MXR39437.1 phosphopentomutase [Mycoplasma sp. MF12]MXR56672.1 phosphopentomutase [Mesomycoplasma flocculare]
MNQYKFKRIFLIVTDSLGIGDDGHQKQFNDVGANTLYSVSKTGELKIPFWKKLGIGNIAKIENCGKKNKEPLAYVSRIIAKSKTKDTLSGHLEMMGIETINPNPNFENGFPDELIKELEKAFDNRKIIGNKSISGTVILSELGQKSIDENKIIVYTSPDSTLQICGHEEKLGLENLYRYAKAARKICSSKPKWNVARVIARPYIGENGNFTRTFNRHDYANIPPKSILDRLQKSGVETIGIGKIGDIFVNQGLDKIYGPDSDENNMDIAIDIATQPTENQFIFVNLVEFDSSYGHRRDVVGYCQNLNNFDIKLAKLVNALKEDDLLIISSDHGNDPCFRGTNHTREALPLTIFSKKFTSKTKNLKNPLESLATIGNLIARNFKIKPAEIGEDIFDFLK